MDKRLESGSRSITPARAGEPGETYELPRVCAMFDKPYVARYTRGAGGLFRLAETVKLEAGGNAGKKSAAPKAVTLQQTEISRDSPHERCAWCGVKSYLVHCSKCRAWVCAGRVSKRPDGRYFLCRASCGAKGLLSDTDDGYNGSKEEIREKDKAPRIEADRPRQLPVSEKRPALAPADRLRLKS